MKDKENVAKDHSSNLAFLELLVEIGQRSKFLQYQIEDLDFDSNCYFEKLIESDNLELSARVDGIGEILNSTRDLVEELENKIYFLFNEMSNELGYQLNLKDELVKI